MALGYRKKGMTITDRTYQPQLDNAGKYKVVVYDINNKFDWWVGSIYWNEIVWC